jgi:hypothetical protein
MKHVRLFHVYSDVNHHRGYKNVRFQWFVHKREKPLFGKDGLLGIEYRDVIEDYDTTSMRYYAEDAVEELFTEDEAKAFVEFVKTLGDETATVESVKLPMPNNMMGVGAIPIGGEDQCLMFSKAPDYDLPFKVGGYYSLRGCEYDATLPDAQRAARGVKIHANGKIETWYLNDDREPGLA